MKSLYELCLDSVCDYNVSYYHLYEYPISDSIKRYEIDKECGRVASNEINRHENIQFEDGVYFPSNINGVLQQSMHDITNSIICEKYITKGVYNVCYINNLYTLYYILQENHILYIKLLVKYIKYPKFHPIHFINNLSKIFDLVKDLKN